MHQLSLLNRAVICAIVLSTQYPALSHGQESGMEGTWSAEIDRDSVGFVLRWRDGSTSLSVPASEIRGLDYQQAMNAAPASVALQIQREPGAFALNGSFASGRGSGRFAFHPNRAFGATVESLGVHGAARFGTEDLIALTIANASTSKLRELLALRVGPLEARDFIAVSLLDVSPRFVRTMRSVGIPAETSVESLVQLRLQASQLRSCESSNRSATPVCHQPSLPN